jgi:hypothetical protein
MSRTRFGTVVSLACLVLLTGGLTGSQSTVAQTPSFRDRCTEIAAFPGKPAAGDSPVPVVVHYMQNPARPDIDLSRPNGPFAPSDLERRFQESGTLNAVWHATVARIRLDLHRLETCRYSLKDFDYAREHEEFPSPAADPSIFRNVVVRYNGWGPPARGAAPAVGRSPARVLDVYVFSKIEVWAGWGVPPRVDPERPVRLGAVWIDTDCLEAQDCDRLFAHELGHFFGLCHVCRSGSSRDDAGQSCPDYNYCPNTVRPNTPLPTCDVRDARLMSAAYTGSRLLPCEVERVQRRAAQLFTP